MLNNVITEGSVHPITISIYYENISHLQSAQRFMPTHQEKQEKSLLWQRWWLFVDKKVETSIFANPSQRTVNTSQDQGRISYCTLTYQHTMNSFLFHSSTSPICTLGLEDFKNSIFLFSSSQIYLKSYLIFLCCCCCLASIVSILYANMRHVLAM